MYHVFRIHIYIVDSACTKFCRQQLAKTILHVYELIYLLYCMCDAFVKFSFQSAYVRQDWFDVYDVIYGRRLYIIKLLCHN